MYFLFCVVCIVCGLNDFGEWSSRLIVSGIVLCMKKGEKQLSCIFVCSCLTTKGSIWSINFYYQKNNSLFEGKQSVLKMKRRRKLWTKVEAVLCPHLCWSPHRLKWFLFLKSRDAAVVECRPAQQAPGGDNWQEPLKVHAKYWALPTLRPREAGAQ